MPSSISSTVCSTPTNDTVEKVIKNDSVRYQRKGYGLISAILITFAYFYYAPQILKIFWPSLLEKITPHYVVPIVVVFFHTIINFICNAAMYIIYKIKFPFFERYRVSDKPWPWESDPEAWKQMVKRTAKTIFITHFIIVPLVSYVDSLPGIPFRIDMESWPSTQEMLSQILLFMLAEDFLFYWSHRLLHHPKIYPYIHKVHHEYNITVSIAAEYAHPFEFVVSNMIPSNIGAKLLGTNVHLITYIIWITLRITETADGHCGYEFSWSPFRLLPLSGSSSYHNFHHSHNVGNYGSFFTFWDTLCGTNRHYFKYLANKEKKQLAARIQPQFNDLTERINKDRNTQLARELEKNLSEVENLSDIPIEKLKTE